jgi:hypothetical protein
VKPAILLSASFGLAVGSVRPFRSFEMPVFSQAFDTQALKHFANYFERLLVTNHLDKFFLFTFTEFPAIVLP